MAVHGIDRFPGARQPDPELRRRRGGRASCSPSTDEWQRGAHDASRIPTRPSFRCALRALEDGKLVYMAVPRLAEPEPFFVLDPARLADPPSRAASIKSAARSARTVAIEAMAPVDLVVTGCVAVSEDGARLGKGGGFSDLEFALAAAAGLVDDRHGRRDDRPRRAGPADAGAIPAVAHDIRVDLIATPTRGAPRARRAGGEPVPRARLGRAHRREGRGHPRARAAPRPPARRLTPMSGLRSRSIPAPGQAPLVAPNAAALLRRNADRVRRRVRRSSSAIAYVDARASTSRSRAGSPRCSSSGCPPTGRRHVAVLLDNTPDYLFALRRRGARSAPRSSASTTPGAASTCCATSSTPTAGSSSPSRGTRRCSRRSPTSCRRSSRRPGSPTTTIRRDARRVARRRARRVASRRPGLEPDVDTHLGADLHLGHVDAPKAVICSQRRLLVTGNRMRDDHGSRPRRRRLRVHAAVPLERGAGRAGRRRSCTACVGRARPAVLGVGLAARRPPLRRDVLQLHRQAAGVPPRAARAARRRRQPAAGRVRQRGLARGRRRRSRAGSASR